MAETAEQAQRLADLTEDDLNRLSVEINRGNHKWWHTKDGVPLDRNPGELLMLAVSEAAEGMEGARKNLPDDKLPHRPMLEVEMADLVIRALDFAGGFDIPIKLAGPHFGIKQTTNVGEQLLLIVAQVIDVYWWSSSLIPTGDLEIRDDVSREIGCLLSSVDLFCSLHNLDLVGAMREKRAFNATREDHTWEAREKEGGKRW